MGLGIHDANISRIDFSRFLHLIYVTKEKSKKQLIVGHNRVKRPSPPTPSEYILPIQMPRAKAF